MEKTAVPAKRGKKQQGGEKKKKKENRSYLQLLYIQQQQMRWGRAEVGREVLGKG